MNKRGQVKVFVVLLIVSIFAVMISSNNAASLGANFAGITGKAVAADGTDLANIDVENYTDCKEVINLADIFPNEKQPECHSPDALRSSLLPSDSPKKYPVIIRAQSDIVADDYLKISGTKIGSVGTDTYCKDSRLTSFHAPISAGTVLTYIKAGETKRLTLIDTVGLDYYASGTIEICRKPVSSCCLAATKMIRSAKVPKDYKFQNGFVAEEGLYENLGLDKAKSTLGGDSAKYKILVTPDDPIETTVQINFDSAKLKEFADVNSVDKCAKEDLQNCKLDVLIGNDLAGESYDYLWKDMRTKLGKPNSILLNDKNCKVNQDKISINCTVFFQNLHNSNFFLDLSKGDFLVSSDIYSYSKDNDEWKIVLEKDKGGSLTKPYFYGLVAQYAVYGLGWRGENDTIKFNPHFDGYVEKLGLNKKIGKVAKPILIRFPLSGNLDMFFSNVLPAAFIKNNYVINHPELGLQSYPYIAFLYVPSSNRAELDSYDPYKYTVIVNDLNEPQEKWERKLNGIIFELNQMAEEQLKFAHTVGSLPGKAVNGVVSLIEQEVKFTEELKKLRVTRMREDYLADLAEKGEKVKQAKINLNLPLDSPTASGETSGSTARVFRGTVEGEEGAVAIKLSKDIPGPDTTFVIGKYNNEVKMAEDLGKTSVTYTSASGEAVTYNPFPEFKGKVDVGGNPAYAMSEFEGVKFPEQLTPAEAAAISKDAEAQIKAIGQALKDKNLQGEVQMAVLTKDIPGVGKAGDIVHIDAGGLSKVPSTWSAQEQAVARSGIDIHADIFREELAAARDSGTIPQLTTGQIAAAEADAAAAKKAVDAAKKVKEAGLAANKLSAGESAVTESGAVILKGATGKVVGGVFKYQLLAEGVARILGHLTDWSGD